MAYNWTGDETKWSLDQKLTSLEPSFRLKVQQTLDALKNRGYRPKLFFGWRSLETQARIVAAGHSTVDFSFHNALNEAGQPAALAADIVDERWWWGARNEQEGELAMGFFRALGEEAKKRGLHWGGDWVTFKDYAHVQMHPNSMLGSVRRATERIAEALRGGALPFPSPTLTLRPTLSLPLIGGSALVLALIGLLLWLGGRRRRRKSS